ncbi:MFS transporter [Streptomyces sp. NPDC057910]|uniref:MFS transporter n=1 Tax=Streptomyces sp. NPDC057910 TaxID=3346278 RepID=UPI0036E677D4
MAVLTAAAFLIFAQAFMVAPILPQLAHSFHASPGTVGLSVPAYLVPCGAMTLVWGSISDHVGRRPVILSSLAVFTVLTALTGLVDSTGAFVGIRLATGIGASGVVPISLALIGDVFPYASRGRALGWLFGGMAGGIAVGSSAGALTEPLIGWPGLFALVAGAAFILLVAALVAGVLPPSTLPSCPSSLPEVLAGYRRLVSHGRGLRTYSYILLNAMLHSGIYTWLGLYLQQRFSLGPIGIGVALLGYGLPGFILGPLIGHLADRYGRGRIIPAGVALAALTALLLAAPLPLIVVALVIAVLSLGYDMTQPLFGGIVTDLPGRRGQALGLNAFFLFTGFGLGSLIFQALLPFGFAAALTICGIPALIAAAAAIPLFRNEQPHMRKDVMK